MRRWLFAVSAILPVLALAQVSQFLDVVGHPHAVQIEFLHRRGIIEGYGHGIFRPDITINRAEFLKILLLSVFGEEIFSMQGGKCFLDFKGDGQWYWKYACRAKELGIVDGYPDGTFRGERTVNLAEALKMVIESQNIRTPLYPDGPPDWYAPYFDVADSRGIFDEFPHNPGHFLTRSEMAVLIVSLVENIATVGFTPPESADDDSDDDLIPFCGNGVKEGDEECDDGNSSGGDGCNDFCEAEEGWNCSSGECVIAPPTAEIGGRRCATYIRFGVSRRICATCGNGVCESFETCTSGNCDANMCTSDCGELYCTADCEGTVPVCGNGTIEANEQCDDGNNDDGDGCSSICVIVTQPVYHAAMRIEQRPYGELEQSQGSNNVALFAFDAIAGRQDANIKGLELAAATGNLTDAQNYRLLADQNGDGIAETLVGRAAPQGGVLAFTGFSVLVKDGVYKRMEVVADLVESAGSPSLAVGFATSRPQYVIAYGAVDGNELTGIDTDSGGCDRSICWIAVFTQSPREVTITDRGNLYVTKDSIPVRSRQLVAGELSEVLMRLKFRAQGEDIEVTDIAISGGQDSVDYLELYKGSSSIPFASAREVICTTQTAGQYCARTDLVILQDMEVTVLVRAFVRPDNPAGVSGDSFTLFMTAGTSPQPAVKAYGIGSDEYLDRNDGNGSAEGEIFIGTGTAAANATITGSTHDITASNIITIENAHSDPDGTVVPLGNVAFAAFRFKASNKMSSSAFPVHIRDLTFTVAADNVRIDPNTVVIYNKLNPASSKSCSASAATGNITVACSNLETSSVSTTVNQGSSVTLVLSANILSAQTQPGAATLQASLASLGNRSSGGTVEWDDSSTTFDWVDIDLTRVRSTLYRSE